MSALQGIRQLTEQLHALGEVATGKALRSAVRAGMKPALERAKQLIPVGVDTHRTYKGQLVLPGFAKRNIRVVVTVSRDKQKASALLGVRREAFYAINFVELGTASQPAQPWLRPAFASTRQQQLVALSTALKKAVARAIRQRR